MPTSIRVRYAPGPTGNPPLGSIHTAICNWQFARHHGGQLVLRIADTDPSHVMAGAVDRILESLEWLGIDWDEGPRVGGPYGPYFQSERLERYHAAAAQLVASGDAYHCYCPPERVAALRREQVRNDQQPGYDGHCRHLADPARAANAAAGMPSVLRFAMPPTGTTTVTDVIRGDLEWPNELTDDFVLIKSDGFPTHHLAVVVDDHAMAISHVLRGAAWLHSTPRHVQLYRALNLPMPVFGHLPMILGSDRAKLSKRHGATALLEYRDDGFLPEALINYMALPDWSRGGATARLAVDTSHTHGTLEPVGRTVAIFTREQLQWLNGVYIRQLDHGELADRILPFLEREYPVAWLPIDRDYLLRLTPLVREQIQTLAAAPELLSYCFADELECDPAALVPRGMTVDGTQLALRRATTNLAAVDAADFTATAIASVLHATRAELRSADQQFFGALRTALTGRTVTPPLSDLMAVMGPERVLARLRSAADRLSAA